MFAVPEVDNNIDISSSIEKTKSSTESQTTTEPLISLSSKTFSEPISTTEQQEKIPSLPSAAAATTTTSNQHLSRLSLFHRNTIHVCDQIVDRV